MCSKNVGSIPCVVGTLIDAGDSSLVVVAAGGFNGIGQNSTELWFQGSSEWVEGPELPNDYYQTSGVTASDGNRFVIVGGYSQDDSGAKNYASLFELQCVNRACSWKKMEQELELGRRNHVAMLVPDSLVYCE